MAVKADWLKLTNEKAIEPDLPICDAHQHIWNYESSRYLASDYVNDASGGHNIKRTITVQSRGNYEPVPSGGGMTPVQETAFVMQNTADLKSKIDIAAGFVGYVDLATGQAVQPVLEEHLGAGKNRFKGIRYPFAWQTEPDRMSNPKVREGFAYLAKYKMIYEIPIGIPKFPDLVDLAAKFQNTPIIIDNLAWPKSPARNLEEWNEMLAEWKQQIQRVASVSNIYMKVGGVSRFFGFENKTRPPTSEEYVKTVNPYIQFVIEKFGTERCMFESNYPPDKDSASFTVIWNAFKLMTKSFSKTERAYMFHDNANRIYNL